MPFGAFKKHVVNDKRRDLIKLEPGHPLPPVTLDVKGDGMAGRMMVGTPSGRWALIVVYSGRHSEPCKHYLATLSSHAKVLKEGGVDIICVTSDSLVQVDTLYLELQSVLGLEPSVPLPFNIAYGISTSELKDWGVYLSDPEEGLINDVHPEPALFLINPAGRLQVIEYSNNPYCRPDLEMLTVGITRIKETKAAIRGLHNVIIPEV